MSNAIFRPLKGPGKRNNVLKKIFSCWQLYVLLFPGLAYILIFHYQPMYGLQIAFKNYMPGLGIRGSEWVGLKHLVRFITSPQFKIVVSNTLYLNIFSLLCGFPLPILLALLLNDCRSLRFKKVAQNITYIPHFISVVVLSGMIINFLSPVNGVIVKIITILGGNPVNYMTKPEWFRPIYIISAIWQNTGWGSIIYVAALSGVDPNLHEAAQIDGANRLQRTWHINIPCILPTIVMMFILRCGQIMNVGFEKAFLLQNSLNISASEVISTYIYKAGLLGAQFSFSSMVGLFNSLINFVIILVVNDISKRASEVSLW